MSDISRKPPLLFVTIVLDGVGVGAQPDAAEYGDEGSHTLENICRAAKPHLPRLSVLGLGNIDRLSCVASVQDPEADFGKMQEVSPGKDSTTGHWELGGIMLDRPFPTYPSGFPAEVVELFVRKTGCGGVLGNKPASGTHIITELGIQHQRSGYPIVYTSADSVFQIAAHKDTIPLERLYEMCETARHEVCVGEHAVGRVIARPFVGEPGDYQRVSSERRDFSYLPPRPPIQQVLQKSGIETVSVGKVADMFGNVGFDRIEKTGSNDQGIDKTLEEIRAFDGATPRFVWVNLVDFDQEYGHRNDPDGFARALEVFDRAIPDLKSFLPRGAVLVITSDHGNDPTTPSTDHSREYVPLLVYRGGTRGKNLGLRSTFADHAASVADYFGVSFESAGSSFLYHSEASVEHR